MKKEVKSFSWKVVAFDCNAQEIRYYDVLKYREDDIKKILAEIDLNNDKKISFVEYLSMMKKFKDHGDDSHFTRIVTKAGKGILRVGSSEFSYQSFSEEER